MILNINQKINYVKSLIVYLIMAQVFGEILLFKQHYGVNVGKITIIITTIIIIIIVVLEAIQHNVMQYYLQHLVLVHDPNEPQQAKLQIILQFLYLINK